MSLNAYPLKGGEPELVTYKLRLLGETTGPTVSIDEGSSQGVSVAYSATGIYTLTWGDSPGKFVSAQASLGAATPADLAGHTVIRDTYASLALAFSVFNAADAAHALVDDEYLDVEVTFQRTSV